jgi:DNA-binding PadR family transcriptional regulator
MINPLRGRTLGAPRGLLRFLVLKMLSEKPMSGMEIIEEIETQTGSWKPSPGSIYPLLAWLVKKDFTKELPRDEMGSKRYVFTEKGRKFLKQQIEVANDFIEKITFLAPLLVGGLNLGLKNSNFLPSKDSAQKLVKAFIFLRQNVDHITEKDGKELAKILDDGYMKLEKVVQRVKNKKTESTLTDK